MKNIALVCIGVLILAVIVPSLASLEGDLNNDNRVNMDDFNVVAKNWGSRTPDWLLTMNELEPKSEKSLTLRQKQKLHQARLKCYQYLAGVLFNRATKSRGR